MSCVQGKKLHSRAIPIYHNPFASANEIRELANRYVQVDAKNPITEQHCLDAGCKLRQGLEERTSLRTIFRWKLQAYLRRFSRFRDFPCSLANEEITFALAPARTVDFSNNHSISHALRVLDSLPYVGVPVASAILMSMYPNDLTIIDRQAYKMLNAEFRDPISPLEYLSYLNFCRSQAKEFGVTIREYDRALWQAGNDAS